MSINKSDSIRSIGRGLAILQVINRYRPACMAVIAAKSGVPYPTACRIVQTLIHEGMVERQGPRHYRPTALVQSLSLGYQSEDELADLARPAIDELTGRLLWPVYVSCRVGMTMVVKASTEALTSLIIDRSAPGYTLPLTSSSSGKVQLAFTPKVERDTLLMSLFNAATPANSRDLATLTAEITDIRHRGYAAVAKHPYVETPGKTSALSVPVMRGDRAVAALSILFFASAMSLTDAVRAYLAPLQETAFEIGTRLQQGAPTAPIHSAAGIGANAASTAVRARFA